MPIYEYECPRCGRFDVIQKMSDRPLQKHDVCGSKVKKLVSASAFAFKGSGFYITDYKGRNPAAITGRDEPKGDSKTEAKAAAKAESKPDAKPSPKADAGTGSKKEAKPAGSPSKKSAA